MYENFHKETHKRKLNFLQMPVATDNSEFGEGQRGGGDLEHPALRKLLLPPDGVRPQTLLCLLNIVVLRLQPPVEDHLVQLPLPSLPRWHASADKSCGLSAGVLLGSIAGLGITFLGQLHGRLLWCLCMCGAFLLLCRLHVRLKCKMWSF